MPLRYVTRGADTFTGVAIERCPICDFPMRNGFQSFCEPSICNFRDKPLHYKTAGQDAALRKSARRGRL